MGDENLYDMYGSKELSPILYVSKNVGQKANMVLIVFHLKV